MASFGCHSICAIRVAARVVARSSGPGVTSTAWKAAGGFGFDWLSRRDVRWAMWGPALAVFLASPFYLAAFASPSAGLSMAMIWLANFVLVTYMAPTLATPQNLVGPRMRALSTAIVWLSVGLVGAGLGPYVLGLASDFLATQAFGAADFIASCPGGRAVAGAATGLDDACRSASRQGLKQALMAVLGSLSGRRSLCAGGADTATDLYVPEKSI